MLDLERKQKVGSSISRLQPGLISFGVLLTWVGSTLLALVVSVFSAPSTLLQLRTRLSAVSGLSFSVANTDPHWGLAQFGAAAPKAPLTHSAVLSWNDATGMSGAVLTPIGLDTMHKLRILLRLHCVRHHSSLIKGLHYVQCSSPVIPVASTYIITLWCINVLIEPLPACIKYYFRHTLIATV